MADLRTDYQDDVLDASKNTARVYDLVDSNGTVVLAGVHLEDKTVYTTEGDDYGAADINEQNGKINELSNDLTAQNITISNTGSNISIERYNAHIVGNMLCINAHMSVTGQGDHIFGIIPSNIELITSPNVRYVDLVMTFDNVDANVAGYIDTEDNTIHVNSNYNGTAICSYLSVCPCKVNNN